MLKNGFARFGAIAALVVLVIAVAVLMNQSSAQQGTARITRAINNAERFTLVGSRPMRTGAAVDAGRMQANSILHGVSLEFSRSAAQETALKNLIAEQQNPASPLYHKWLTPDQFAARFGLGAADLARVEGWLQAQGLKIEQVSRARTRISFSGTVSQIESAFGTEMHYYRMGSETHFSPSRDISVPAALSPVVLNVGHLSDLLRPRPRVKMARPNFTSSQSGNHFLTPKDVATIYNISNPDINPNYTSANGFNGAGQAIAIVGQSAVSLGDIENFQNAGLAGLAVKDPQLVLVPGTGTSAVSSGDESESDLDLEYSSGIATGATIYFVYVGNDTNFSAFDSIAYAVDTRIAPIISSSYGICESALTLQQYQSFEQNVLSVAVAQGQTVIGPAGDSGSTDCNSVPGLSSAQQQALAVDYPASSPNVTAMGGSEFPTADVCAVSTTCTTSSAYWAPASGSDVVSSALSYMPNEGVWNDDTTSTPSAGGGGVSAFTPHQSWQNTSVPGITSQMAAGNRMVPDISLSGSNNNAPYLFCSSDSGFTGVTGSCSNGFRDAAGTNLTAGGGTSFDAPIFAGLVALLNQMASSDGQGLINPTLYGIAASNYSTVFHNITAGNNFCPAGATYCAGSAKNQYAAATGYDMASGLGSIDFNQLLAKWCSVSACSTLAPSITTLTAATPMPAVGAADVITITVAPGSKSGTTTPTGSVNIASFDPTTNITTTSTVTLSSGTGTYSFTPAETGSQVITGTYVPDVSSPYAPSTGTVVVGNGSFRLSATNVTVADGNSATSTVTVTPQNSYTGTIQWSVTGSSGLSNACASLPNTVVSGSSAVAATLTIATSSSSCSGNSIALSRSEPGDGRAVASVRDRHAPLRRNSAPFGLAAGLLVAGLFACRPRKWQTLIGVLVLAMLLALGLGCGSSSKSPTPTPTTQLATKGTYTLTVTGTDTTNSSIAASTTLTLTID
jgi:subtilase family serine protease